MVRFHPRSIPIGQFSQGFRGRPPIKSKVKIKQAGILFPILILLCFAACKKHEEESTCVEHFMGNINLTDQERLINPYHLKDSLVFFNKEINNRISYVCDSEGSYYSTASENDPGKPGYKGCLGNYYNTENFHTWFGRPNSGISIQENSGDPFDSLYMNRYMVIYIGIPGDSIWGSDCELGFRQDTIFTVHTGYGVNHFYDTITIHNTLYQKVYKLEGFHGPNGIDRIIFLYYSLNDGILRFETKTGLVWELEYKRMGQ